MSGPPPWEGRPSSPDASPVPSLEEVRSEMDLLSAGDRRGQKDALGFAVTREQMAEVWAASEAPPVPEGFGVSVAEGGEAAGSPEGPAIGLICPHDDYIYAGRVVRSAIPLVQAPTVIVIGVFHKYRRMGVRGVLVFDPYRIWRTPEGALRVSALRAAWRDRLAPEDAICDAACHDIEHSIEAIAYWLHHGRPDREIVPVLAPAGPFERIAGLAERAGTALADALREHGLALGRDVAIVISADAVHYGEDFQHTPFGPGGEDAYARAVANDRRVLLEAIGGAVTQERVRALYETFVDPQDPDSYRLTWCGRFSIPFGMLLLAETARALGDGGVRAEPIAYATSVGWPELALRPIGLGPTAPASLQHFVGYPAVRFVRVAKPAGPDAAAGFPAGAA